MQMKKKKIFSKNNQATNKTEKYLKVNINSKFVFKKASGSFFQH